MYSLFANAEQLPEVPLALPKSALGVDTVTALKSGVLLGYSHLVSGMIQQIQAEVGANLKVMATGGLSFIMENIEDVFDEVNVHLTLEGMRLIYQQTTNKSKIRK
jgi:type III pantothenate kinase